jgi:tRNA(fMet)-specific endonuclease VapC
MLDTNIMSDVVHNPHGKSAIQIALLGESAVAISIIVAAELRFGAEKRKSANLTRQLERILEKTQLLAFESPCEIEYARIRAFLAAKGQSIGGNDLFIAAHAKSLNMILVTDNAKEFKRVPGLKIENWLR